MESKNVEFTEQVRNYLTKSLTKHQRLVKAYSDDDDLHLFLVTTKESPTYTITIDNQQRLAARWHRQRPSQHDKLTVDVLLASR